MGEEKRPLEDEAAARKSWRGEGDPAKPRSGHSLPASEDEDERRGAGEDAGAGPRTPMPPD